MTDKETLSVYAGKAGEYAEMTADFLKDDPLMAAFIGAVPPGGKVLDLGCGPGASAAVMARAGLEAHAWDPVPEMLALAGQHAGVTTKAAGFDELSGENVWDGIWASFSLLHAPRESMPMHLKAISRALKPGGAFHIGMKTGTGSKRDDLGRLYTYYTAEELTGLLQDAGLEVLAHQTGEDTGLDGVVAPWIRMDARA